MQASNSQPTFQKYQRNRVFMYSEDGGNKFLRNFGTLVRLHGVTSQRIFGVLRKPISDCPQNGVRFISCMWGRKLIKIH